jgi:hypothetical protein
MLYSGVAFRNHQTPFVIAVDGCCLHHRWRNGMIHGMRADAQAPDGNTHHDPVNGPTAAEPQGSSFSALAKSVT